MELTVQAGRFREKVYKPKLTQEEASITATIYSLLDAVYYTDTHRIAQQNKPIQEATQNKLKAMNIDPITERKDHIAALYETSRLYKNRIQELLQENPIIATKRPHIQQEINTLNLAFHHRDTNEMEDYERVEKIEAYLDSILIGVPQKLYLGIVGEEENATTLKHKIQDFIRLDGSLSANAREELTKHIIKILFKNKSNFNVKYHNSTKVADMLQAIGCTPEEVNQTIQSLCQQHTTLNFILENAPHLKSSSLRDSRYFQNKVLYLLEQNPVYRPNIIENPYLKGAPAFEKFRERAMNDWQRGG